MNNANEFKRDAFFDLVKAFAIFLVVFGHVSSASGYHCKLVSNFIIGMNMPCFFLMSGWFAHNTLATHDVRKLCRHLRSYFQPMTVISILFTFCAAIIGCLTWDPVEMALYAAKRFLFATWFLWALAFCYVISFVVDYVAKRRNIRYISYVVVLLAYLFIPEFCYGLFRVCAVRDMLPYFLLGHLFREWDFRPWTKRLGLASLLLFLIFIVLEGDVKSNGMAFYWADSSWRGVFSSYRGFATWILRPVVGVLGSIGVMWVLQKVVANISVASKIAKIGEYTIGIYLLHQWILDRLLHVPCLFSSWMHVLICSVVLMLFCCLVTKITIDQKGFLRRFVWGR